MLFFSEKFLVAVPHIQDNVDGSVGSSEKQVKIRQYFPETLSCLDLALILFLSTSLAHLSKSLVSPCI